MFAGHHLCAKGACGTTDYEQRNYNLRVKRTGGAFFFPHRLVRWEQADCGWLFLRKLGHFCATTLRRSRNLRALLLIAVKVLAITRQVRDNCLYDLVYFWFWKLRFYNTRQHPTRL